MHPVNDAKTQNVGLGYMLVNVTFISVSADVDTPVGFRQEKQPFSDYYHCERYNNRNRIENRNLILHQICY